MAHSRTARKAIRQNKTRHERNKAANSAMRTQVKKVANAVDGKDANQAQAELQQAQRLVDKAAKTHRIHKNKAARMKSKLAKSVNRIGES